jgi:FkbM family methyltransferase
MESNLIYDVGAHRGEDCSYYLKKGFEVVGVEAHPDLAQGLRERFCDEIKAGQLHVVESAIADHEGEVTFYANRVNSVWGTIRADWAERNRRIGAPSVTTTVEAIRFESLLKKFGVPYYMKVDIEGADLLCLEALLNEQERPRFISIESEKRSWDGLIREFALLDDLGYTRFKIVDQRKISSQVAPYPSREGSYVEQHFENGSTGLFGNDLGDGWLSVDEALRKYKSIFFAYRVLGDSSPTGRIIRHLPLIRRYLSAHWYDTHARRD